MTEPTLRSKRPSTSLPSGKTWWTREDVFVLVLLGLLVLLPGLGQIPLFDRDEPRFATSARTMMETGDYLVPRFNGALRPDKPPLVYWLMNLGYWLTGRVGELGARLPSVICGIGTLLVTYFMTGSRFGRLTGMVAAIMLGTSVLFMFESRMATADGTMVLCITICMACAWQAWDAGGKSRRPMHLPRADYLLDRSGDKTPLMLDQMPESAPRPMPLWLAITFWVALAAGTLTKGVPLLFVLVPMVVLSIGTGQLPEQLRRWRSHFRLTRGRVGLALAIAAGIMLYVVVVTSARVLPATRLGAVVLGAIVLGMILLPGLPGILVRCFAGGNWSWWRHLRPQIGGPLLLVLTGWWVIAAGMATEWKLIHDMVGIHFLNRVAGPLVRFFGLNITGATGAPADPMKSYGKPPGFYLVTVWGTFWPWCILLVPAGYHTVRRALGKTALALDPRPYHFLLAFVVPMWILLELARGKLLHYPLPIFVALAILCADTLVQSWYRLTDVLAARWFEILRWGTCLLWVGGGAALLVMARQGGLDPAWVYRLLPFGAALMAIGLASAWTWGKPSWPFVLALTWGGALLVMNTLVLPEFPALQVSRTLGNRMAEIREDEPNVLFAGRGYEEPTLVFYARANVEMLPGVDSLLAKAPFMRVDQEVPATAPPLDMPRPTRILAAVDDATREELDRRGIRYYFALPPVSGINTGNFRPIRVALISNLPDIRRVPATGPATGPGVRLEDIFPPEFPDVIRRREGETSPR